MSKDNVIKFIKHTEKLDPSANLAMTDRDPKSLVMHADNLGVSFTEEDLKGVLNSLICNAESLPRPWGWVVARKFGLVRS